MRRGGPVIITPQAALNLFTPKGTLDLIQPSRKIASGARLASGYEQGDGIDRS
jgi:hypothetical protein